MKYAAILFLALAGCGGGGGDAVPFGTADHPNATPYRLLVVETPFHLFDFVTVAP